MQRLLVLLAAVLMSVVGLAASQPRTTRETKAALPKSEGKTAPFSQCSTSADCTTGTTCVHKRKEAKSFCKPICSADDSCASLAYRGLKCLAVRDELGTQYASGVCNEEESVLADTPRKELVASTINPFVGDKDVLCATGEAAACAERAEDARKACESAGSSAPRCYDELQCRSNVAITSAQMAALCPGVSCVAAKRQFEFARKCGETRAFVIKVPLEWNIPGARYTEDGDFALIRAAISPDGRWGGSFQATNQSIFQHTYAVRFKWGNCRFDANGACDPSTFQPVFEGWIAPCSTEAGHNESCQGDRPWATPRGVISAEIKDKYERINAVRAYFVESPPYGGVLGRLNLGDPYDNPAAPDPTPPPEQEPPKPAESCPAKQHCIIAPHQSPGCFSALVAPHSAMGCARCCAENYRPVCVAETCVGDTWTQDFCGCAPN